MKKVAILLALLLSIGMISCDDNADKSTETGTNISTTASSIETYETTSAETTESAVMTTVGNTIDIDAELAGYTVYEVTTELIEDFYPNGGKEYSYFLPYKGIEAESNITEKGSDKIALKFTDLDDITLLMEKYDNNRYKAKRFISTQLDVYINEECFYGKRGFGVEKSSDMAVFCFAYKYEGPNIFYIIKQNTVNYIINDVLKDGYYLYVYSDEDKICYSKTSSQYVTAIQAFHYLVNAFVSDGDFYKETGVIVFDNNQIDLMPQKNITFGEWFLSDSFAYKEYRDKYGVGSFGELIDIYNNYVEQGKEKDF